MIELIGVLILVVLVVIATLCAIVIGGALIGSIFEDGIWGILGPFLAIGVPAIIAAVINLIINKKGEHSEIKNLSQDSELDSIQDPIQKAIFSEPEWRIPNKSKEEEEKERRKSETRFAIIWASIALPAMIIWIMISV